MHNLIVDDTHKHLIFTIKILILDHFKGMKSYVVPDAVTNQMNSNLSFSPFFLI